MISIKLEYIRGVENSRAYKTQMDFLNSSQVTSNFAKLKEMDAVFICVPTPIFMDKTPNLSFVISASNGTNQVQCISCFIFKSSRDEYNLAFVNEMAQLSKELDIDSLTMGGLYE